MRLRQPLEGNAYWTDDAHTQWWSGEVRPVDLTVPGVAQKRSGFGEREKSLSVIGLITISLGLAGLFLVIVIFLSIINPGLSGVVAAILGIAYVPVWSGLIAVWYLILLNVRGKQLDAWGVSAKDKERAVQYSYYQIMEAKNRLGPDAQAIKWSLEIPSVTANITLSARELIRTDSSDLSGIPVEQFVGPAAATRSNSTVYMYGTNKTSLGWGVSSSRQDRNGTTTPRFYYASWVCIVTLPGTKALPDTIIVPQKSNAILFKLGKKADKDGFSIAFNKNFIVDISVSESPILESDMLMLLNDNIGYKYSYFIQGDRVVLFCPDPNADLARLMWHAEAVAATIPKYLYS